MKKLLTSLVLVLVLCLACSIAFADDAKVVGEEYKTITLKLHGDGTEEKYELPWYIGYYTDAELAAEYPEYLWIKKPTCTSTGTLQVSCLVESGRKHVLTIDKIAHSYEDKVVGCLRTRTCTVCGKTFSEGYHTWSSETGDLNWGKVTEMYTCTEGGKAQDYCIKCGELREKYRTIEPIDHLFGQYEIVSMPQCVMGANGEEYKTVNGKVQFVCTRCGVAAVEGNWYPDGTKIAKADLAKDITVDKDNKILIGGEDWTNFETKLKAADANKLKNTKYPAAFHDFDGWVTMKAATCTAEGIKTHWCKRCGATYNDVIKPLGHDFVERETLKNCFISQTDYVCSRCNFLLNAETYAQMEAELTAKRDNEADYAKKAEYDKELKAFQSKYAKIAKASTQTAVKAHQYNEIPYYMVDLYNDDVYDEDHPTVATCTKPAYRAYYCIHFWDGSVGMFGETHDEVEHEGIKYVQIAPAKGHVWGAWETVFKPGQGENEKGYYTRQCSVCGAWENRQTTDATVIEKTDASNFVVKLFKVLLGEDDVAPARVYEWSEGLEDGTSTAADVIKGFVGSEAFAAKFGNDNEGIVKALYSALLSRGADSTGLNTWTDQLNNGVSMNSVINGFTTSEEFKKFAEDAGFEAGELATESRDVNPRVTAFVERCYTTALGRDGEDAGLNYWTDALLTGAQSPKQVAAGFVFSTEYDAAAKIADEDEVEDVVLDLYWLYLGRGASETEVDWYVDLLNNGMKLEELNTMFADSVEFANIVSSYGLNPNL